MNKSISEIINDEYRQYSMYVLENRAIPHVIDGLKAVTRKLLYASIDGYGGKKTKCADLGSISRYNYNHGEASAIGAVIGMAAEWSNNAPIFQAHGNFGSRLIQDAAAPRYIYVSLSENYKRWFRDIEVAPKALDQDNPEPAHYLPIIPWILINGTSGIAVGFASTILPHSTNDVVDAVKKCIKNPDAYLAANKPIKPTFPHFRGEVVDNEDGSWRTRGIIEYVGKYTYEITELPIGYDREKYVEFLNELENEGLIRDYTDNCSGEGFGFTVRVSGEQKSKIEKNPHKYFKLEKNHSENLTTLDVDGKLKIFNSVAELVHYFVQYRTKKVSEKLEYELKNLSDRSAFLKDKIKFIEAVIANKIDFRKTSKSQLLEYIQENITTQEYGSKFTGIPLYNCTTDEVESLRLEIKKCESEFAALSKVTPTERYLEMLNE